MTGRFDGIAVGDQVMRNDAIIYSSEGRQASMSYFLVTDLWFDPVRGQYDGAKGEMVAIQQIGRDGGLQGSKRPHTRRGLASNGYQPADRDYIAFCKQRLAGMESGKVIGIGAKRSGSSPKKAEGRIPK